MEIKLIFIVEHEPFFEAEWKRVGTNRLGYPEDTEAIYIISSKLHPEFERHQLYME